MGDTYPVQIGGYVFGFSLGVLVEERFVQFTNEASSAQKILRLATGGLLTGLLALAMEVILSSSHLILSFANSFVSGLFVAAIVPALFTKIERRNA